MNNKPNEASPSLRNPQLETMEMETERLRKKTTTNRDWLNSLSTVELVCWLKNTASAMSDAELLKWMEEKHENLSEQKRARN